MEVSESVEKVGKLETEVALAKIEEAEEKLVSAVPKTPEKVTTTLENDGLYFYFLTYDKQRNLQPHHQSLVKWVI